MLLLADAPTTKPPRTIANHHCHHHHHHHYHNNNNNHHTKKKRKASNVSSLFGLINKHDQNQQQCCEWTNHQWILPITYYFITIYLKIQLACSCSTWTKSTTIPTKAIATLIITNIAAVALDLGHAVGMQRIISKCTIKSPIRKGRGTKSRRHLSRQIVIVKIQSIQIDQLRQGEWNGSRQLVGTQRQRIQSSEFAKLCWYGSSQVVFPQIQSFQGSEFAKLCWDCSSE